MASVGVTPRAVSPSLRRARNDAGPPTPLPKSEIDAHIAEFSDGLAKLEPADLVHSQHWMSGVAALPVARAWGVPHVQSYHSVAALPGSPLSSGEPPESSARVAGEAMVVHTLRALSASQIDRHILRMRDLRDRARDLLQRQRVAMRERTGSKRGESGDAVQQRSKDKIELLSDMLKRFEGQLKIARKAEAAGQPPKNAPKRHATRKAAKTRGTAPGKDFTAARMRSRRKDADEAADTMRARKNPATDASAEGRHATGRRVVKSPTTLSMSGWTSGRSKMVRFSVTPPPPLQADSTLA